jgi:dTDP-4-dehydrorhamnose reductase
MFSWYLELLYIIDDVIFHGINPLVKEPFNIDTNISNENSYTWYTFATEIFKEVELNKNVFN